MICEAACQVRLFSTKETYNNPALDTARRNEPSCDVRIKCRARAHDDIFLAPCPRPTSAHHRCGGIRCSPGGPQRARARMACDATQALSRLLRCGGALVVKDRDAKGRRIYCTRMREGGGCANTQASYLGEIERRCSPAWSPN